ncbi:MAG: sulfur carrier protein ThiS [Wujia sp.]
MQIMVSGERKEVRDGMNLQELIALEETPLPKHVVVMVNDEIVEPEAFSATILFSGDTVEFLAFMGGG